jgi:t-SNARE complex subunit (syntaxin)
LVEIEKGVFVLREIAVNMGKEIEKQTELIEKNDRLAEKTNVALDNMNQRMRKALESVRKQLEFLLILPRYEHVIVLFWTSF